MIFGCDNLLRISTSLSRSEFELEFFEIGTSLQAKSSSSKEENGESFNRSNEDCFFRARYTWPN